MIRKIISNANVKYLLAALGAIAANVQILSYQLSWVSVLIIVMNLLFITVFVMNIDDCRDKKLYIPQIAIYSLITCVTNGIFENLVLKVMEFSYITNISGFITLFSAFIFMCIMYKDIHPSGKWLILSLTVLLGTFILNIIVVVIGFNTILVKNVVLLLIVSSLIGVCLGFIRALKE